MGVNLDEYTRVLSDDFGGLSTYDGRTGIWTTGPRRDLLVTNGPQSVFLDGKEVTPGGESLGIDPFEVEDGVLHIGAGRLPEAARASVAALLNERGQGRYADSVQYYTGMITTADSWGQTYGYFEVKAQVPAGQGHWSAFWMAPAGIGWPPEIDVFEAYGKGLHGRTDRDDTFSVAVYFDDRDPTGAATQNVDISNPYAPDADGNPESPLVKNLQGREQHLFYRKIDAHEQFEADIYDGFWTYATEWTPDEIIFYFGRDRDSLVEIYRTPTPEDLHSPMVLIANDQISSTWGWNPAPGYDDRTFAPDNDLKIDSISVYALNPERVVAGEGDGALLTDGPARTRIIGTAGDDVVVGGAGMDVIELNGGRDTVFVDRGVDNEIISGFGPDDRLVLEGFPFDGAADALARLTQVGNDVWLISGADPANPQTVLFKNAQAADFSADNFVVRWSMTRDIWSSALHDAARVQDSDADGSVRSLPTGSRMADASRFAGPVTLEGSRAGDVYFVYRSDTRIREAASGGVDTVYAHRSFALPENVESLIANVPRDGLVLTGNAQDNRLVGGAGADVLAGAGGSDLVELHLGGIDRVIYRAGDGHDTVAGFGTDDVLVLDGIAFPSWAALRARLHAFGQDTVLDLGEGASVTFRGVRPEDLSSDNFAFPTGSNGLTGIGFDPWWRPNADTPASYMADRAEAAFSLRNWAAGDSEPDTTSVALRAAFASAGSEPGTLGLLADGGAADDRLTGGARDDCLLGGGGNDRLNGRGGADALIGEGGSDVLYGGAGDDVLRGGEATDRLWGGAGMDAMFGGADADILGGEAGSDRLCGNAGDDSLRGGEGRDSLLGGAGHDLLDGGTGDDVLAGEAGKDRLYGGPGADRFVLAPSGEADGAEIDLVMDFSSAQGDRIDISAYAGPTPRSEGDSGVHLIGRGAWVDLAIDIDDGGPAVIASIRHVTAEDLHAAIAWSGDMF